MIECPICHVQNDDRSLFCAECGQRFAPPASQAAQTPSQAQSLAQAQTPPVTPEESPKRPPMKLRSPMLGGGDDEPDHSPGQMRPFGKAADASSAVRPKGRLRGPETGDDPPEDDNAPRIPTNPTGRRGLHSPLLHLGVEEEHDEPEPAPSSGGMFPHRSNSRLSAHTPEGSPPAPVRPKSLRSPLLGGDPQFDDPDEEDTNSTMGGRGKRLRSPVLGGPVGQYEDEFEPPQVDDNPNTLRSPLLARRVSKQEVPPPAAQGPAPAPPRIEPVVSSIPSAYGANAPQPSTQAMSQPSMAPAPSPVQAPPAQMPAPYSGNPSSSLSGFNPLTYGTGLGVPTPADYAPGQAPLGSSSFDPPPAPSGYQGNATWPIPPQPGVASQTPVAPPAPPSGPPKILPPAGGTPSVAESGRGYGSSSPNPSRFGSDTESGASAKGDVQYGEALPSRAGRSASRSKLLPNTESQSDRVESYPTHKHMGFAKFMMFPLLCAAGFKVWYLVAMGPTALSSMPFLGDQVSQLVVIVCLMIFTFLATSESSS